MNNKFQSLKQAALPIIFVLLILSCGYLEELNLLANQQVDGNADDEAPTIISVNPPAGSKIDDTISYIEITYSEEVDGAGNAGNYSLSGAGVGSLSLGGIADQGDNTYRITVSGTPGDGTILINISNVTDTGGNDLETDQISYTGWWDLDWAEKYTVAIDNSANSSALADFQIKVELDNTYVEFWNDIESDGRSLRFIAADNATAVDFWIQKFDNSGRHAIIWAEIPSIPAAGTTSVNLYFSNAGATAVSNGVNTFIFFDDFEDADVSDWTIYSGGAVTVSADPDSPTGSNSNWSLEKINNSDPNGGYKLIGSTIGLDNIFEGRIYRDSVYGGGAADRPAIENGSFNGYGFLTNHGTDEISIERRTGGAGSALGTTSYDPDEDTWYLFSFYMLSGGTFHYYIYDIDGFELASVLNVNDGTYSSFNLVIIHGGYEYFADDLHIRKYTNPQPIITIQVVQ